MEDSDDNPMHHPAEQQAGTDGAPRFGRLLLVLLIVVLIIGVLTLGAEAYFSE